MDEYTLETTDFASVATTADGFLRVEIRADGCAIISYEHTHDGDGNCLDSDNLHYCDSKKLLDMIRDAYRAVKNQ